MATNLGFDRTFVINLESRTDRLERVLDILHSLEIPFERFSAIDKDIVSGLHKNLINVHNSSTITSPGYLACLLSHLSVYKIAVDRGYKNILVLEDDIYVHKNVKAMINKFMSMVPQNWDMIHFGYLPLSEDLQYWTHNDFSIVENTEEMICRSKNLWCTHAYAIKREYMIEILNKYNTSQLSRWLEIDRFFVSEQKANFDVGRSRNLYACLPALFGQAASQSDLTSGFYTLENEKKFIDSRKVSRDDYI